MMVFYIEPTIIKEIEDIEGDRSWKFKEIVKRRVVKKEVADKLMAMMRKVVISGTGKRAGSFYYDVAGKTGTSKKFIMSKGSYTDRVISSFVGLAPYSDPGICILIVIDEPENQLSGGQIAAPLFSNIIDRILPYLGFKNFMPAKNVRILKKTTKKEIDITRMPDLRGMRLYEALEVILKIKKRFNVQYSLLGIGRVFAQKPLPGEKIENNKKIIIKMAE
jgi:membrane peptidoglycan carboxypeptidase